MSVIEKLADSDLTEDQCKLIEDLLAGKTVREIADELGIHYNTVLQRKKKPLVKKALQDLRKEYMVSAQNKFVAKASWAAQKIIDMVDDPNATRVQFQAACKIYDVGVSIGIEELEERVIALEEQVTREV